ncbi:uncharacterized protein FOMMEDRAFT_18768 [Fomitiporia mediterranea MF3/22]|uniref:uncharacterized protein n=1 Tax=Fomitiporia mediterranea (strain MF3/22) TaxID=694068 RepID=UPI000440773C|nr:uncharacterized protein FOMMEDRAFT_18768 [Fomitiporia mediterranea MF3/22]EJD05133.1 hypothetical protein FOMMEDRAFT_18768 [Fomitiporia mediterranea MF3/22]
MTRTVCVKDPALATHALDTRIHSAYGVCQVSDLCQSTSNSALHCVRKPHGRGSEP